MSTDSHEFVKQMMLDWFNPEPEPIQAEEIDGVMRQVDSVMVCDSRNLYDALEKIESSGLHLEEKGTARIWERTKAAGISIRWCDSDQQLADGLSKNNQYEQLISIFAKRVFGLVFDPQITSAKKKRAASRKTHGFECMTLQRHFRIGVKLTDPLQCHDRCAVASRAREALSLQRVRWMKTAGRSTVYDPLAPAPTYNSTG